MYNLLFVLALHWNKNAEIIAEIIERVRNPIGGHVFRPILECLDVADYVLRCIKSCWDEDPEQRPDIRYVRVKLKEMQAGL